MLVLRLHFSASGWHERCGGRARQHKNLGGLERAPRGFRCPPIGRQALGLHRQAGTAKLRALRSRFTNGGGNRTGGPRTGGGDRSPQRELLARPDCPPKVWLARLPAHPHRNLWQRCASHAADALIVYTAGTGKRVRARGEFSQIAGGWSGLVGKGRAPRATKGNQLAGLEGVMGCTEVPRT